MTRTGPPGVRTIATVLLAGVCLAAAPPPAVAGPASGGISQERYIALMNRALDDLLLRLEGQRLAPVSFSANLFFAHETAIRGVPLDVLTKMVDALADAGVARVDINMGLFPWREGDGPTIEKYDRLVEHIRARGLGLAINPQYSPVHRFDSFAGWGKAALDVYPRIAERYQPEIFVVVHEPTTQAGRLGVRVSPSAWEDFAREAARKVRAVAPRARLGAGGLGTETAYLDRFMGLAELELLTIDVYALRQLPAFNGIIERARRHGKTIYIEETWRPGRFDGRPGKDATLDEAVSASIGNQAYQALDVKWLRAMTLYAASQGLEAVTPFWTQTFFAYVPEDWSALDPRYSLRVIEAVRRGERTKTYEGVRGLIREFGAPPAVPGSR